jgi:hypothetical protein
MPRFVILEHDHPHLHWDLMLEDGDTLRTWRLSDLPRSGVWVDAEEIAPHRLAYLDYEGEVSGGRGTVKRWERGIFVWSGYAPPLIMLDLYGERWSSAMILFVPEGKWRCFWLFEETTSEPASEKSA